MTLKAEVLRALAEAGASIEMILAAVAAEEAAEAACHAQKLEAKRVAAAERQKRRRERLKPPDVTNVTRDKRDSVTNVTRDKRDSESTTPEEGTPESRVTSVTSVVGVVADAPPPTESNPLDLRTESNPLDLKSSPLKETLRVSKRVPSNSVVDLFPAPSSRTNGSGNGAAHPKKAPSVKTVFPADFEPNEADLACFTENGITSPAERARVIAHWRDHHGSKGNKFVDWHAALRSWIRSPFQQPKTGPPQRKASPYVP